MYCLEVNWNIVDSLTCNFIGYHLHMGHYSFDYDKAFWYNIVKEEEEEDNGKLKDYLSVSKQQVPVSMFDYLIEYEMAKEKQIINNYEHHMQKIN
ncbi:hypothetical protein T10_4046 [Trichinella papuae]|uniref:Uncharacterized protein n=1 Tax=Trichinella papuae TaxID=268474 RepID=A0A0V1MD90_9BILA|nr:hypothetical protein T10_4046 [Trichinella papuae]